MSDNSHPCICVSQVKYWLLKIIWLMLLVANLSCAKGQNKSASQRTILEGQTFSGNNQMEVIKVYDSISNTSMVSGPPVQFGNTLLVRGQSFTMLQFWYGYKGKFLSSRITSVSILFNQTGVSLRKPKVVQFWTGNQRFTFLLESKVFGNQDNKSRTLITSCGNIPIDMLRRMSGAKDINFKFGTDPKIYHIPKSLMGCIKKVADTISQ